MTETTPVVEQRHRDAAADLIEAYWSGADAGMMKLAASYRAGHSYGTLVRAFARFEATLRAPDLAAELAKDAHLSHGIVQISEGLYYRALAALNSPAPEVVEAVAIATLTAQRGELARELLAVRDQADALTTWCEALEGAVLAVVNATRAYLPPDGIDAQECLNRVIGATDNPTINPIISDIEHGRS